MAAGLLTALPGRTADFLVYAGTYADHGGKGIYLYRFQTANQKLTALGLAVDTMNPSSLVDNPNQHVLYATNEIGDQTKPGIVSAFTMNVKSGKLTLLNQVSSKGGKPCQIALDVTGKWLAVANCAGGSVAILPVLPDGRLGEAATVQQQPAGSQVSGVVFSPDNHFLLAADGGLDRILVYRFDPAKGSLTAADPAFTEVKPGSGVRHLAFYSTGTVLYALSEKASSVTAYKFAAETGALEEFQSVLTWPLGFSGTNAATELAINPAGTVLYASNSGLDAMAQFAIEPGHFTLMATDYPPVMGHAPRHFALDPSGRFLFVANQDSGNLTVFHVHPRSGQLQPTTAVVRHVSGLNSVLFVRVK